MFSFKTKTCPKSLLAGFAAVLLGLAGMVRADGLPMESSPETVQACEELGAVNAHSGYGKHVGGHWEKVAKSRALRKADKLGASHVVWEQITPRGVFNGHVTGTMFDCEP